MKYILIIFFFVTSCAVTDSDSNREIKLDGHLILAAGGSQFVVNDLSASYQVGTRDMPKSVWEYLNSQKILEDPSSMTNESQIANVSIKGYIYKYQGSDWVIATKIISLRPCDLNFYQSYIKKINSPYWTPATKFI